LRAESIDVVVDVMLHDLQAVHMEKNQ
jgi:hypothetical protein